MNTHTHTVKSSELRPGDVVLCHGMRVLIDGPIHTNPRGCSGLPVTYTNGRVLNRAEVSELRIPHSFTAVTTGYPSFEPTGEHRWQVQGNDLATWTVERAEERAPAAEETIGNVIPAAHFHTVVNALHESYLSALKRAREYRARADGTGGHPAATGERAQDLLRGERAARRVAAERFAAFETIMRNAPIDESGDHRSGCYRVRATEAARAAHTAAR